MNGVSRSIYSKGCVAALFCFLEIFPKRKFGMAANMNENAEWDIFRYLFAVTGSVSVGF